MKKDNSRSVYEQEYAQSRRLKNLQSVVGLVNWTLASPTPDEIKRHHQHAHLLRSNAIHERSELMRTKVKHFVRHSFSKQ